jgi:hypothetical protein
VARGTPRAINHMTRMIHHGGTEDTEKRKDIEQEEAEVAEEGIDINLCFVFIFSVSPWFIPIELSRSVPKSCGACGGRFLRR